MTACDVLSGPTTSVIRQSGKLVFLIRSLAPGGTERQLVLLASELHRRGLPVLVGIYYPGGIFERELKQAGVPMHCLNKSGRWDVFGFIARLLYWLWRERPAVVHGYLSSSNLLLLLLRPALRMRGIAVACGIRASVFDRSKYDRLTRLVELGHLRAVRFADVVICNSIAGRDLVVASGTRIATCSMVDNGIDTRRYFFAEEGRLRWRKTWGIGHSQVLVGMVGRHHSVKGYEHFIDAAAILVKRFPDLRFVVVGAETPGYTDHLRSRVNTLSLAERWIWAGYSDDLAGIYSALDIFCLASTSEGFPNVVGEAMSCGLPCVVTNVGDAARLLGDNGWVVPSGSPEALAIGLTSAIEALPHWDREASRRRIEEDYGVERLVDRTLAALAPWLGSGL